MEELIAALEPFANYASIVDDSAHPTNPIGDTCPPVGGYENDHCPNAKPLPTIGDCRRALTAWKNAVAQTELDNGMVRFSVSIPPKVAEKLRHIQRLTGLGSMEDVIRFLMACTASRIENYGHDFHEVGN